MIRQNLEPDFFLTRLVLKEVSATISAEEIMRMDYLRGNWDDPMPIRDPQKVYEEVAEKLQQVGFTEGTYQEDGQTEPNLIKVLFRKNSTRELVGDEFAVTLDTIREFILDPEETGIGFEMATRTGLHSWKVTILV